MLIAIPRTLIRIKHGQRPLQQDLRKITQFLKHHPLRDNSLLKRLVGSSPRKSDVARITKLEKMQILKMRRTLQYMANNIPYYQKTFKALRIAPQDFLILDDIQKFPFTTRVDLQQHSTDFISTFPGLEPTGIVATSGTSGQPLIMYYTNEELEYWAAAEAILGLISGSLGPGKISQIHMPVDLSLDALIATTAARMAGSLVLSYGITGSLDEHIDSIFKERQIANRQVKVSSLALSPNHLWALTQRAIQRGIDFDQSGLKQITAGSTIVSDALKKLVKDNWGIRLTECYGMVEAPTLTAAECHMGTMHLLDLTVYSEILDPVTKKPALPGSPGILVITTFYPDRELMPLLRYWTNDLVIASSDKVCPCGIVSTQITDILGRAEAMITLSGRNYYPQEIGDSLLGFPELVTPPRFKVTADERADALYAVVDVECREVLPESRLHQLIEQIRKQIIFASLFFVEMGVVKIEINLVPQNSIQNPFPYKIRGYIPGTKTGDFYHGN